MSHTPEGLAILKQQNKRKVQLRRMRGPRKRSGPPSHYTCFQCGNIFPDIFSLRAHKQVHTQGGKQNLEGQFKCTYCSMSFAWKCFLDRHLVAHTNEKKFACQFCSETFKRNDALKLHQLKRHPEYVGSTPYKCDQCGVFFSCKSENDRHMRRVHSDLRPYSCSLCNKSFKEMTQLNKHTFTSHKNVFSL